MHQQHVPVTVLRVLDRLPGADRHDVDRDAALLGKDRQQVIVEAGVRSRGGRLQDDRFLHGQGRAGSHQQRQDRDEPASAVHGGISVE
jgi:hypothetical protein